MVSEFLGVKEMLDTLLPKLISGEIRIPDAEQLTVKALACKKISPPPSWIGKISSTTRMPFQRSRKPLAFKEFPSREKRSS